MLKTVKKYINEHNMIEKGDRIVVGVSGGADSVCLFHVLLQLIPVYDMTLFVVHINHGIRGEEADLDEAYVKELCDKYEISFTSVHRDVPALAVREGLSEEEAGRKVRYEAFYNCLNKNKCNKIAIAHNRNDNAETILFHLFRGSGIKGLTGIQGVRDEIIRPLLGVGRKEIEKYLENQQVNYLDDRTNFTQDYSRNKIRHSILGFAQDQINSKAIEHIVGAGIQLKEIEAYLDKMIEEAFHNIVIFNTENAYEIDIGEFLQEDLVIQKGILRKILNELAHKLKDIDASHIELLLDLTKKGVGKRLDMPYGILAKRGYHSITLKKELGMAENISPKDLCHNSELIQHKVVVPGKIFIPEINKTFSTKLINYKKSMIIPRNGCTKWFDYDKIKNTVLIRTRKEGDFIQIDANGSRKKIKSLFIDEKIPKDKRDFLPLLSDGDHIMWIVGGRMSEAYKVNKETKVILEINLMEENYE